MSLPKRAGGKGRTEHQFMPSKEKTYYLNCTLNKSNGYIYHVYKLETSDVDYWNT